MVEKGGEVRGRLNIIATEKKDDEKDDKRMVKEMIKKMIKR